MHMQDLMPLTTDMTMEEFLGRVLMAALENETYEIQNVFAYGGNLVDFQLVITNIRPAASLEVLQEQRM